jgi:hypothetical protein
MPNPNADEAFDIIFCPFIFIRSFPIEHPFIFNMEEPAKPCDMLVFPCDSKTFQNLKVSSAAALATVVPSGLKAKCNTLLVCPLRSAIFFMVGYFQMQS